DQWMGIDTVCDPNPCPQPPGACCFPDGHCEFLTQAECTGTWLGIGTVCDPNPCPQPPGACCFHDGTCQVLTQVECTNQSGEQWLGFGTACDPNPCDQPQGACCFTDGTCQALNEEDCTTQGGDQWMGIDTVCDPNPCLLLEVEMLGNVPNRLQIRSLSPNPTTGTLQYGIDLPAPGNVRVRVVDVSGTVVTILVDREFPAGSYMFTQNIDTKRDGRLQNGVYFLYLEALEKQKTRRFVLTR
ncbi:T9SS type A sorting domain-containing protein, partial [Candidatus Eisenbacteria bacterium]